MVNPIDFLRGVFISKIPDPGCKYGRLEGKIDYTFKKRDNLREALTHSSILGELPPGGDNTTYERLEFLGDSVLGLVTTDYLMKKFPKENEGQLTKKKSLLVSRGVLSKKAEKLKLKEHIILSDNAQKGGVHGQDSIQAAVLEALIGALYIDGGFEVARRFIERHILGDIQNFIEHRDHINYKSELQEWTQRTHGSYPEYLIRSTRGPDHDKIFFIEVKIEGITQGKGRGKSKKDAEQMAAKEALEKLSGGELAPSDL